MRINPCFILLTLCAAISGCATVADKQAATPAIGEQYLYIAGEEAIRAGDYAAAIRHFRPLIAQNPAGTYAAPGRLSLAYAYYESGQLDAALIAANDFLKHHPEHPRVDYAIYLKGLAILRKAVEPGATGGAQYDDETRARLLQTAVDHFRLLAERYPTSGYRDHALQRRAYAQRILDSHAPLPATVPDHTVDVGIEPSPPPESVRETAVQVPEPADTTSSPAPHTEEAVLAGAIPINNPAWLLKQQSAHYTLELLSGTQYAELTRFVGQHRLFGAAHYLRRGPEHPPRYVLVHGLYPTQAIAESAAGNIARALTISKPVARRIADIQIDIRRETSAASAGP